MTLIPTPEDPTLKAIEDAMERESLKEGRRDYLGASELGGKCARAIWYNFNGYEREPFKAKTLMNFEDGHRSEDLMAKRLRMVNGVNLVTKGDDGKQMGFSVFDGKFKGHYDGIISGILQAPKTKHVWEHKSCAEKKWKEFIRIKERFPEKDVLENWNYIYYVQAQMYMHYEGLDRHYLTVGYAGGRDHLSCRTNYDGDVAARYIDRADKIIRAQNTPPRIADKPDFYVCRMCNFRRDCHV